MTTESINHPEKIITHPMGRFAMDIPASMRRTINKYNFWYRDIKEIQWPQGADHDSAREAVWQQRLTEINALEPPEDQTRALIEVRDFSTDQQWIKGLLYYGDSYDDEVLSWDVLLDKDQTSLWIKDPDGLESEREKMAKVNTEIAKTWHPYPPSKDVSFIKDGFHLEHGAIQQPFKYKEELEIRFEGYPFEVPRYGNRPDDLILDIEMRTIHKAPKTYGLLERLAASLAMNFAPGVDIDKLRTGKRTIAGLEGEEILMRGTEHGESELSFSWMYLGQKSSGGAPRILIEMTSKDDQVDEKIALWDAMLNSLRPIGR